jgi:hypothetical protein
MSDDEHDAGAARLGEHWLTSVLQSDVTVLRIAADAAAAGGDAATGALAARRAPDEQLRQMTGWPRAEDYARMAADYQAQGRAAEAALLRQAAATDDLAAEARARWNHRYTGRPVGTADEMMTAAEQNGMLGYDPDGPYRGIDGALYRPGILTIADAEHPVVVVSARGGSSFAIDWHDYAAMSAWVASRGTTGSGLLARPPVPYGHLFRPAQEEAVLARMLAAPGEAPALAAGLPPDTFTSDVRYDIYAAILATTSQAQRPTPERVAAEMDRRIAWVPEHALAAYGGHVGSLARTYLSRLAETPITGEDALAAAQALHAGDERDRARGLRPSPDHAEDPGPRPRHQPEITHWLRLEGTTTSATTVPAGTTPPGREAVTAYPAPVDPGLRPPEPPGPESAPVPGL